MGNEIPNSSSPYSLVNYTVQGLDQFEYGNNNKGTITPSGTEILNDESYFYNEMPSFINSSEWGGIGTPNLMEENNIPAQTRFESNTIYNYPCDEEEPVLQNTYEDLIHFRLYPNPSSDLLIIDSDRKGIVFIYNANGSEVVDFHIEPGLNKLNLISLPIGIYRVVLLNMKKEIIRQKSFMVD